MPPAPSALDIDAVRATEPILANHLRLLVCLDGMSAVRRTNPLDRILTQAGKDRETRDRSSRPPVSAEASGLDDRSAPGAAEEVVEGLDHRGLVHREAEVRPIDVGVGPGGKPLMVEVEPEVGHRISLLVVFGERRGEHRRAVG